ncbi:hypothetical protein C8D74_10850 [Petrotoga sibirica]|uniref:Uncharacterized protein n=1 Tax=Petrotoga sibirica TaxID=156202 RepID=A0A4R8EW89_9BACT|nr:hypothetical protein C8D74_10850 [Petrotoga sibirica]
MLFPFLLGGLRGEGVLKTASEMLTKRKIHNIKHHINILTSNILTSILLVGILGICNIMVYIQIYYIECVFYFVRPV